MTALKLQSPVKYRPPGPGLKTWMIGTLVSVGRRVATVRTHRGKEIEVKRGHVKPAPPPAPRPPLIAKIAAPAVPVPRVVHVGPARADGAFVSQDKPRGRIKDPGYLKWICTLDCHACPPEGQRTQSRPAHFGPRPTGRKTDDWRSTAECDDCHLHFWHGRGHLPGLNAEESRQEILSTQIACILRYFAPTLHPADRQWYALAALVDRLPFEQREEHLRVVVDLLVEHLYRLGKGRVS